MKKFLLILGTLLLLVVVGVAVFIATFDADRYRPLLVSKLQEAIKRPVTLDHLSLGWRRGLALQLKGLTIADASGATEPLLRVDSAAAVVKLWPLLHKDVQIGAIVFQGLKAHVSRDAQGAINLTGLAAAAAPAGVAGRTAQAGAMPVAFQIASFRLLNGAVHYTDAMTKPPLDLWINKLDVDVRNIALGKPMDVTLHAALAGETPNLHVIGRLTPPADPSLLSTGSIQQLQVTLDRVALDQLLPQAAAAEPQLRGIMSLSVQGSLKTLDPAQILRAVTAQGRLQLADAKVENLNVLRSVFERFSMVPGLLDIIETKLPPAYQEKLTARDTVLRPIDVSVQVQDGALRFRDLRVQTDVFDLSGSGVVGFAGGVHIESWLRVERDLSMALIQRAKVLQAITNAAGQLEIPLIVQGQIPRVIPMPDVNYLTSRLLATKAQDVLEGLLRRAIERNLPSDQPAQAPTQ